MYQPVLVSVVLPGFAGMISRVQRMSVRDMGVMPGLLMIARLMVFGGFAVMFGRLFVMLGGLMMMLCSLVSH